MKRKVWALLLSAAMLLAICLPALCAAAESGAGEPEISSVLGEPSPEADLYAQLMAATKYDAAYALISVLTDAEKEAFLASLSEEQQVALEAHLQALAEAKNAEIQEQVETVELSAVNFTKAGPFLAPATSSARRLRAAALKAAAEDNGLEVEKSVSEADQDGVYTLTMEAWATGSSIITSTEETVPTDIILVLDQSGSMADNFTNSNTSYKEVYANELDKEKTYYVYREIGGYGYYTSVTWCQNCGGWTQGCWDGLFSHHEGHICERNPKTSADSEGTQLYVQESTSAVTKLQALKTAVAAFTKAVAEKTKGPDGVAGTADDVNHKIAIVGFASTPANSGGESYGNNTEILSIAGSNSGSVGVRYNQLGAAQYASALQDMSSESGRTMIENATAALAASGATRADLGMEMAASIYDNNPIPAGQKRNRVVIMFTDGEPNSSNGFSESVANDAISNAADLKKDVASGGAGATVYTIGVMSGADGSVPVADTASRVNKYMHYCSSNFKNAQSMDAPGTATYPSGGKSYYLSANDSEALNNIFETISQEIESGGSSITLDEQAVVKDVLTDQFQLPAGTDASAIKVYTQDYTQNGFANKTVYPAEVSISADGKTISVTNFDYAENYVGTVTKDGVVTYRGKKLIVEIPIVAREGFFGGNNVATNGTDSGVYENAEAETPLEAFPVPEVNVPLNVPPLTAVNRNIYLLGNAPAAADLCDLSTYTSADAWKVAYVQFADPALGAGTVSNTQDSTVTIAVTVSPKTDGNGANGTPAQSVEKTAVAQVNVFKPELTFQDSEIYLGDQANYLQQNVLATQWKHGQTLDTEVSMTGAAPTLGRTYNPVEGAFAEETDVTVSTAIGGVDVTAYTTFVNADDASTDHQFTVKVKTCTLTIQKLGAQAIDENQSFLFRITGADNAKAEQVNLTVTVVGNGSAVVRGLPIGTYTVSEESGWSWRYTAEAGQQPAELKANAQEEAAILTFENTRTAEKWLDGSAYAENAFGAVSQ